MLNTQLYILSCKQEDGVLNLINDSFNRISPSLFQKYERIIQL